MSAGERTAVLAERHRQKAEADRLRRKAPRLARYGLSPATDTADAESSTVVTHDDETGAGVEGRLRSVSLLGLVTD